MATPATRSVGRANVENRTRHVTTDQIRQVHTWLTENPNMGRKGVVVLRRQISDKFREINISMNGVHSEALLEKGIQLGWLRKEKDRMPNGATTFIHVAVELGSEPKEEDLNASPSPHAFYKVEAPHEIPTAPAAPVFSLAAEEPEQAEQPATQEAISAEALLTMCGKVNFNGADYLLRNDVLEAVTIIAEERDNALASAGCPPETAAELESARTELESLERMVETLRKEKTEATKELAKAKLNNTTMTDANDKLARSRDSWQRDAEKWKDLSEKLGTRMEEVIAKADRLGALHIRMTESRVTRLGKTMSLHLIGELKPDASPEQISAITQAAMHGTWTPVGI